MSLAPYVKILGRGPGSARSLTQDEAFAAMQIICAGKAEPEATGALLMLLRMKGETAEELAGCVAAARQHTNWASLTPDVDWPSYAAGRTRGLPWFLLSAKLVAQAGHSVLLHGWNSHQSPHADVRAGVAQLGIPVVTTTAKAASALTQNRIAYAPLESFVPKLFDLLRLRDVLGLRSCINTVLRLLNPGAAQASVQGVFHPSYREVQTDASALLGQPALTVIKGGGGEFERHPGKEIAGFGLRHGADWSAMYLASLDATQRLAETSHDPAHLTALWQGDWHDPFAQSIVLGTAALALDTLSTANPDEAAHELWHARHRKIAA